MLKKITLVLSVIGMSLLFAFAAYAQNGNGRGGQGGQGGPPDDRGNGINVCDGQDCLSQPQVNAYQNGGVGFVNPQTGEGWNGQQRGRMNRGAGANGTGFYAGLPPATVDTLPDDVVDLMIDGWLDEQHAYAVYESIMAQYGEMTPFVNIQQAELQHAAAWEMLFDRYGIETPDLPAFDVPLFDSPADACMAAADAEIANFTLYDEMLASFAAYPDLYQVALSLRNASEFNHLPAFEMCAQ